LTPLSPRERDAFLASLPHVRKARNGMLIEYMSRGASVKIGGRPAGVLPVPRRGRTMAEIRERIALLEAGATWLRP
jgi:hypothetical protein